jgi:VanZ family protein
MRKEFLPALIWALFIFVLCAIPGNKIPEITFWHWLRWDKLVHLFLFGALSLFLLGANSEIKKRPLWFKEYCLWIVLAIIYGGVIEIMQATLFLQRSGDWRDAMANAIGAISGGYFFSRKKSPVSWFKCCNNKSRY